MLEEEEEEERDGEVGRKALRVPPARMIAFPGRLHCPLNFSPVSCDCWEGGLRCWF